MSGEPKLTISAELFLRLQGIEMINTALIVHIDGALRQPNLCELMELYAKANLTPAVVSETPQDEVNSAGNLFDQSPFAPFTYIDIGLLNGEK
jgi:hypothetical protein